MSTCTIVIKDEVNIQLNGLSVETRRKIVNSLKYEIPGARHTPAYKLGRWDGMKTYFSIGGTGYLGHLPTILPIIQNDGYEIAIDDLRVPFNINFAPITESYWADQGKTWPKGHVVEGQPIMLRDDQANAINMFLSNPQSMQSISTGAGKCLTYDNYITLVITELTPFITYLYTVTAGNKEVNLELPIGRLIECIEDYTNITLDNNEEISTLGYGLYVNSPDGLVPILSVIKKYNLPILGFTLSNGHTFSCATTHIVQHNGVDALVNTLSVGDSIGHESGPIFITDIVEQPNEDCYDISLPAPHLYYDTNGIIHHNTITTATMSHICEPYGRTVIIVPSKDLVIQTEKDFINVGLDVGVYFGTRKELNKTHTICTWQSLGVLSKKSVDDDTLTLAEFIEGVVTVIVDEAHVVNAAVLTQLLTQNFRNCPIRWGLTGTIPKGAADVQGLLASLGPVTNKVSASELQDKGILASMHINVLQTADVPTFLSFPDEYKYLTTNKPRLEWLSSIVLEMDGNILILVNRVETGKILQSMLPNSVFLSGADNSKTRGNEYDSIKSSSDKILIATYGIAAVGINIVRINQLVIFEPGKSFTRVIQSIGRGLRKGLDKNHIEIWDITSTCKFSKRHLTERKAYYKEAQYPFTIQKVIYD